MSRAAVVWWQELIDGYASNAATISTNRRAVSSPRSIPIAVLPSGLWKKVRLLPD